MDGEIVGLLKKLIMEYNRVSLPCLGSFLSEYTQSYIADGKIYPPSKKILFLQNEIWNDEKLEKSLAQHLNESVGTAKEHVAFWVDHICVLLATGEDVVLPELGKLCISDLSNLMFEQDSDNLLLDSFGLEAVEMPVVMEFEKNKQDESSKMGASLTVIIVLLIIFAALSALTIAKYILTGS
ncbi:MAG: hypothetical protein LBD59_07760 [Prevotellaceae bacterium]|jgi:hypothetical protein|nr:hypothetical protein [Prevotellaceae bacterium]